MLKAALHSGNFVFYRNTYDFFHNSKLSHPFVHMSFKYNNRVHASKEGYILYFPPSVLEHYVTVNETDSTPLQ